MPCRYTLPSVRTIAKSSAVPSAIRRYRARPSGSITPLPSERQAAVDDDRPAGDHPAAHGEEDDHLGNVLGRAAALQQRLLRGIAPLLLRPLDLPGAVDGARGDGVDAHLGGE